METNQILNDAIDKRFPNAKFIICCFKTIDEIENKILTSEYDTILYSDQYIQGDKLLYDAFLIKRKENCNAIYYKDVIDVLIENNFIRKENGIFEVVLPLKSLIGHKEFRWDALKEIRFKVLESSECEIGDFQLIEFRGNPKKPTKWKGI